MASCGSSDKSTENTPADAQLVKLYVVGEAADNGKYSEYPGKVEASHEVNMAFKVSGTLSRVYVDKGSRITQGQLLAEIDPRDYQLQLEATDAEYMKVSSEAQRVIDLYNDSATTADNYDKARYGMRQISAKYQNARNQLADTRIYAPFNGSVQEKLYDSPSVVGAGMPVLSIISDGRPEVVINIPASVYNRIDEISECFTTFTLSGGEERVPLRVISVTPKANANQLYEVRLAIADGVKQMPTPGMSAMVKIRFNEPDDTTLRIPTTAISHKDGGNYVWVVAADSTIARRPITIERLLPSGEAIVSSGINRGEAIVAAGVDALHQGTKVKALAKPTSTNVGGLL